MKLISQRSRKITIGDATFEIRMLNAEERAEVAQESMTFIVGTDGAPSLDVNAIKHQIEAVKRGLIGWEGIVDEDGKEVPFDKEKIKWLPPDVLDRLAGEILGAGLSADEGERLRG